MGRSTHPSRTPSPSHRLRTPFGFGILADAYKDEGQRAVVFGACLGLIGGTVCWGYEEKETAYIVEKVIWGDGGISDESQ